MLDIALSIRTILEVSIRVTVHLDIAQLCVIEIHFIQVPEHAQSGFLSGANFLLPWDVQVRLENAASWARTLDKARHRRKPQPISRDDADGQAFMLKIFVGCEYECSRGHRFFMSSPDTILRGGSGN